MIYTSYFAKLKSLPDNVIPISICGKAPDWYKGLQYKKLAPKYEFFMKWKETHDNDYYVEHFQKEEICTYRENDREFLLSIRNGAFQKEDGSFREEFFEMVSDLEAKLKYAKENTSLPVKPNMKRIEEFVIDINSEALKCQ